MSAETVLTQAQIDDATGVLYGTMANHQETQFARAVEQAVLQSPEVQRLREDAAFGKVALKFDKRARWPHEGDPAESICSDFAQAMAAAFNEIIRAEKP